MHDDECESKEDNINNSSIPFKSFPDKLRYLDLELRAIVIIAIIIYCQFVF